MSAGKTATVGAIVERLKTQPPRDAALYADRGETIYDEFLPATRYVVDFASDFGPEGWKQYDTDQDAEFYGTWVNAGQRLTLSYCEGDWTLCTYADAAAYRAAIVRMNEFHGEGSVCRTIDANGTYTVHRQDRAEFLADADAAAGEEPGTLGVAAALNPEAWRNAAGEPCAHCGHPTGCDHGSMDPGAGEGGAG